MALICFDFDNTLVNGHFHNQLIRKVPKNNRAKPADIQKCIDKFGLKNQEEYLYIIRNALKNQHQVAITSFTGFLEVISPTLEAIGLEQDEINQIYYKGGFPPDGPNDKRGKNLHIEYIMKKVDLNPASSKDKEKVWLIDDDMFNIKKAKKAGFNTILVPSDKSTKFIAGTELERIVLRPNENISSQILTDALETHKLGNDKTLLKTNTNRRGGEPKRLSFDDQIKQESMLTYSHSTVQKEIIGKENKWSAWTIIDNICDIVKTIYNKVIIWPAIVIWNSMKPRDNQDKVEAILDKKDLGDISGISITNNEPQANNNKVVNNNMQGPQKFSHLSRIKDREKDIAGAISI